MRSITKRPAEEPRLLFKSDTSLSKGYELIKRFSEDINLTGFRDDLDEPASVEELQALSNKKRRAKLDAIRNACRAYITGPLMSSSPPNWLTSPKGADRVGTPT
ncbi:nucleotidyl transferase AbiEii/AbiGii toxin family protein [Mesorhizobium sp. B2-6-4]|uniref:nucleotidyl transferase AbiEii/AbiGii toxin family protein n=1 Tax=Mesorhizobium sp. B2-6-4 TaxID=2589913 RepID=UPI001FEEAE60|nr:nucleotidyl transferase AbiEii/AbiGii toxin family protein [Mesorhizobium sp. B2-6-4]